MNNNLLNNSILLDVYTYPDGAKTLEEAVTTFVKGFMGSSNFKKSGDDFELYYEHTRQLVLNGIVSMVTERPIAISKNNNSYGTGTRLEQIRFSQTYLRRSYNRFIDHGWFEEKKGYRGTGNHKGRTTRFWCSEKFIEYFKDLVTTPPIIDIGTNFVFLNKKTGHNKRKVEYDDTPMTESIKSDLQKVNDEFMKHSLTLNAPNIVVPYTFMELMKIGIIKQTITGNNTECHYKIICNKTDNIYQHLKYNNSEFKYHNYSIVKNTKKNALLNNINIMVLKDVLRVSGNSIHNYFNSKILSDIGNQVIKLAMLKDDVEYFYYPKLELTFNNTKLTRTFIEDFKHGGRYNHLYQHIPSYLRQHLEIDGEATVEYDFDACIIQMMYNLEGEPCPEDPYGMIIDGTFKIDDDMPKIQTLPDKKILSKIINESNAPFPVAISYPQENKVITKKLQKFFQIVLINATDKPTKSRESGEIKAIESATKAIIQKLNKTGISGFNKHHIEKLIDRFNKVHAPIADYLFSGIGKKLQYHESNVANQVMLHFAKKEVMCLCIHDSYRIAESHKDELIEVVEQKYCEAFGFKPMFSPK